MPRRTNGTGTSAFGVGRRESHDASEFYARFQLPDISRDATVSSAPSLADGCVVGDGRRMEAIPDNSVALVVTSPPYFAGKEYEAALGEGNVPGSYVEFLRMLEEVLAECKRVLEPGGRMAVNVANLGRKPYRSLSADVIGILQDRLGLLLRGEVIWKKGEGAAGNCAWGSFRSPANPVLRDISERVLVASKGRFDRARSDRQRREEGLPSETSLTSDEFMAATLDVWEIEPESARRVGHPAPFPVELPERLIHLYTYQGDLVLDPFMGSGSTLVAAARTGRRWLGYDLDERYAEIARERVAEELRRLPDGGPHSATGIQARVAEAAKAAPALAAGVLEQEGFTIVGRSSRVRGLGLVIDVVASDADGRPWYFDVTGAFTTTRGGLLRTDAVLRCLGRAHVLRNMLDEDGAPLVLLTSHLPRTGSDGDLALRAAGPRAFFDALEMMSPDGRRRLSRYAQGGHAHRPLPGFWTDSELQG